MGIEWIMCSTATTTTTTAQPITFMLHKYISPDCRDCQRQRITSLCNSIRAGAHTLTDILHQIVSISCIVSHKIQQYDLVCVRAFCFLSECPFVFSINKHTQCPFHQDRNIEREKRMLSIHVYSKIISICFLFLVFDIIPFDVQLGRCFFCSWC